VELWYELGDLHFHYGRIIDSDAAAWEAQAEKALRRAVEADSAFAAPIDHLASMYARQGRKDDLRALVNLTQRSGFEGATADFIRWRAGEALGDAVVDTASLDSMATETLGWIGMVTQDEGLARPFGERAIRLRSARPSTREERFERHLSLYAVALNGGRPRAAVELSEAGRELQPDSSLHLRLRVLSALYGDGDRPAAEQAAAALGTSASRDADRWLNACVLEQWRLTTGASASAPVSRAPSERVAASRPSTAELLCEATVEAMRASQRRDSSVTPAIARLDDLIRSGLTEFYVGDGHLEYGPDALARVLEASGNRTDALAAVRRRPYDIGWQPFLAASLRTEGRLASAVGDRAGAIRAYEHHLALRHAPEPWMRASTDSVRVELARLRAGR
jgi:hypothetical protein